VAALGAAIASDIGNVRNENQDRAAIARGRDRQGREFTVVTVADGIGGMRDGGVCAAVAIGSFLAAISEQANTVAESSIEWLKKSVNAANRSVYSRLKGDGGSTLVALLIKPGQPVCWLSVGDSRVYSKSGKNITQVSVDDTIAGQLGKSPDVAMEQLRLLQFIGMGDELEPHIEAFTNERIDSVILTTDGVHYLASSPNWLGQIITNAPDPGFCVKRLVDLAKWCGGPDNASVVMIDLTSNREHENRPSQSRLEVWDAFGELQIIENETVKDNLPLVPYIAIREDVQPPIINRDEPLPVTGRAASRKSPKSKHVVSKSRGRKATPRVKPPADCPDAPVVEIAENEEPQLLIEFPTKPT
jgi:serine/threonine protein phosphatase PrpC